MTERGEKVLYVLRRESEIHSWKEQNKGNVKRENIEIRNRQNPIRLGVW